MMKQQYIKLFSFLLGISFIASGVIHLNVQAYKNDKAEKIKNETAIADEIGDVYKTFITKGKDLSTYRDKLLDNMSEYFAYYVNMPDGYQDMIGKIKVYEEKVKETEDISYYLKEKCKTTYSVADANEKCDLYYKNLEKSINVYLGDIEFFNSKIDEYNEWTKVENESVISTKEYKLLEKYNSTMFTDYVDLNGDGTYLGMNSD